MDSLITAAAQKLAGGDPIGALKLVALRDDASGLALRGIALAQLGEYPRARELLRTAARAFTPREAVARARCVVAEAEIALVMRDIDWTAKALGGARATLERHGDRLNAALARGIEIRRLLLLGRLDEARAAMAQAPPALSMMLEVTEELARAQIAMRHVDAARARTSLDRAAQIAAAAGIPALAAEVESARVAFETPVARRIAKGRVKPLRLEEVARLYASDALIVDDCRFAVRRASKSVPLATRPVLLSLARTLAEAWPGEASRDELIRRAFRLENTDESHRARLRVEIGRLRTLLKGLADVRASSGGFVLRPRGDAKVVALARPVEGDHLDVLALLADGEAWSTSALAQAVRSSQRTLQRSLEELAARGKVRAVGAGRVRRWVIQEQIGFTTLLLLPAVLPAG
jgi:hypothetical protein